MTNRIGTLHLDYRANVRDRAAAAMAPHLDRLLASRLAEAVDARLPALLGDDQEVIVIKDVHARATIRPGDLALDGRVVDAVGRSTIDAIATVLAAPAPDDQIVRFADQAEFIGSFIVDLLRGSAWDRWYFGAFYRYRQGDEGQTLAALLAEHRDCAAAVFGWLARRGHLDAVLARLGPERASQLAMQRDSGRAVTEDRDEVAPLFAAAFRLIESIGWDAGDESLRTRLVSAYLETEPIVPTWTDRRSLTAWVLRFIHFAIAELARSHGARSSPPPVTANGLHEDLDWLDLDWLTPQLDHLSTSSPDAVSRPARSTRRILTASHEQTLARLAELIRLGRVRLSATDDAATVAVRLMAALADGGAADASRPDRPLALAIERIARALMTARLTGWDAQRLLRAIEDGDDAAAPVSPAAASLARDVDGVNDMGPAAQDVLRRIVVATVTADAGDSTAAAGLFLLTRAMIDVKLHVLAREADVPFGPLRVALAAEWLDLSPPFDAGAALWVGRPVDDPPAISRPDALARLETGLGSLLLQQRAIDDLPAPEASAVGRIGWMVLRAWSRWLPGIAHSSPAFLVRNCLRRQARARVTPTTVDLHIGAAPLDVTLDMAGYFQPIVRVPWLDGRTVTFTKRRGA